MIPARKPYPTACLTCLFSVEYIYVYIYRERETTEADSKVKKSIDARKKAGPSVEYTWHLVPQYASK